MTKIAKLTTKNPLALRVEIEALRLELSRYRHRYMKAEDKTGCEK